MKPNTKRRPGPLGRLFLFLDKIIEGYAIALLVFLIVNVFAAVIMRRFMGQMFPWSEEMSLLSLTWFSFMGIAIGFREDLHLSMDLLDHYLSPRALHLWDKVIELVVAGFGLYLFYFGLEFTLKMSGSTLAVTGWPNMIQYIVIPITGILTSIYAVLRFLGYDLRRYNKIDEQDQTEETKADV